MAIIYHGLPFWVAVAGTINGKLIKIAVSERLFVLIQKRLRDVTARRFLTLTELKGLTTTIWM